MTNEKRVISSGAVTRRRGSRPSRTRSPLGGTSAVTNTRPPCAPSPAECGAGASAGAATHRQRQRSGGAATCEHRATEVRGPCAIRCSTRTPIYTLSFHVAKHSDQEQSSRERRGSNEITGRKVISFGDFKDPKAARSHDWDCRPSDQVGHSVSFDCTARGP